LNTDAEHKSDPARTARQGGGVEIVTVPASLAGQRVDNFLITRLKGVPRSLIYKLMRRGEVRVNKGRVKPTQRLAEGDLVRLPPVRRGDEETHPAPPAGMLRDLSDAVLYEDERLMVLNKPSGMAVHGGSGISNGVIEALRAGRPGSELELVHRLDRDTSGCLLISKRRSALRTLHAQMRDGKIDKRYRALLAGTLPRRVMQVDLPLRKNQLRGGERMVQVDPEQGKPARTLFRRAAAYAGMTLVDVELHTGRTHQIRVHAASLGAPVAGDDKYGDEAANRSLRQLGLKRLFLHACALSFRSHEDGPVVRIDAPLPPDLVALLERLKETQ
jgi:23S rRNA pseudouridine955/2504/2580 synthase